MSTAATRAWADGVRNSEDGAMLLSERGRELVDIVARLGPVFEERVYRYDRDAAFPTENFADLRDVGFLGLCIPVEHGGLGADFTTYALVSEEIGRHCGSTGLTFNMHSATMLLTGFIADRLDLDPVDRATLVRRRAAIYRGVIEHGHIHSQPFSEGLLPGATQGYATRATRVDGGWSLTGRKIFASLSDAADRHNVVATVEGDDTVRLFSVPADSVGVRIVGEWDPLGMRGTISKDLILDGVVVPDDAEIVPAGMFDQAARRFPYFYMTLSFTFLGLMRGALDFTRDYLRGVTGPLDRRHNPQKQAGWAEMLLRYERAQALHYRVLGEVGVDPDDDQVRRAWVAVVTCMESAPEVCSLAVRVCGGRSLLRPQALERLYRDARCGSTMLPWSVEVCLDRLGRAGLADDASDDVGSDDAADFDSDGGAGHGGKETPA